MAQTPYLTSDAAACCWIPLFALRSETARRPELVSHPVALIAPDDTRRVWQLSSLARRAGVKAGMTVSQAIGVCPALKLCEPDPVHYDGEFSRLLAALSQVSPVIEPAELGRVYVGTDGLEGLLGNPELQIEAIKATVRRNDGMGLQNQPPHPRSVVPSFRLGLGRGKFVSWVAASRAKPGESIIVQPGEEGKFLASQPISVLPLDLDTHRRLRQLGLKTLGALAALPEEAVASQFGATGRRLWRLAAGRVSEPVVGRVAPEPIVAALAFFSPVAGRELLEMALDRLIERALKDPRRIGWRVQALRASAGLEQGASWLAAVTLKEPTADRDRIAAPLKTQLERSPPAGAVERLVVEFTALVPGTEELQLFARDATSAARAARRRALQGAAREIKLRVKRSFLYHIIEVQPWSRLPERRYALIDYEP